MNDLYFDIEEHQCPIIYRPEYNISFCGLEKIHPSDSNKWGNVFEYLKRYGVIDDLTVVSPRLPKREDLLIVHPKVYLRKLQCSLYVAQITEIPLLMFVPNFILQKLFLKSMRYQTGGSVLAGKLALERGWAINLGGGFHHCSSNKGAGFCPYADIQLMVAFVFNRYPERVKNVMIIDLDAHQGNGYQRDFKKDDRIFILDVYNRDIYPQDKRAKEAIDVKVEVSDFTADEDYLQILRSALTTAFALCQPDLIIYNAGADVLANDPLGYMNISPEGFIKRDEMVFQEAFLRKIPIVMVLSGGYLKISAKIVAQSIMNLHQLGLITQPKFRF